MFFLEIKINSRNIVYFLVEKLLNETDIILTKYNGNLDLICATPGKPASVKNLHIPISRKIRLVYFSNDKYYDYE